MYSDYIPNLFSVLVFALALTALKPAPASAQDFDKALNIYQQQQYAEAAALFEQLQGDRARLFTGKSYFALGNYLRAKSVLSAIGSEAEPDIYREARYTAALTDLQLENFAGALETWQELSADDPNSSLASDAGQRYEELLGYLTLNQRRGAFRKTTYPQVKFDLIRSAMGNVSWSTARVLVDTYRRSLPAGEGSDRLRRLEDMVSDSLSYGNRYSEAAALSAPEGMIYDIGVALPLFDTGDNNFTVSQGLYYGYLLAVEEFNGRNGSTRAVLRHRDTGPGGNADSIDHIMTEFAWNIHADALFGPLFSEAAAPMAKLAETYEIPMLAPLANSDSLNFDNPYVYQSNPTLATHGRMMARYAQRDLQLDTLAVLVERGSLGESSAFAFRDEFERLGGEISYFFSENLQATGYEITDYTRHFTDDQAVIDSLSYRTVEGIYAPFTGQAARTLMELLLIDLNAINPSMTVLGSPEWGTAELSGERIGELSVYYSESFYTDPENSQVSAFNNRYRERFGLAPDRFARIGFDTATYVLRALEEVQNPALLKEALKERPPYQGLINTIRFEGRHINQHVYIMRLEGSGSAVPVNR